jgi:hypothetical protein
MGWARQFTEPIPLPGQRTPLITLRDAAQCIIKLPKAERDADEWQTAMQVLMLVAEQDGPTMFARLGVMRALHRDKKAAPAPRRKRAKVYKVVR